jgi:hypothetical protein
MITALMPCLRRRRRADGIQFAIDRGVQRLQLETDCQVLINLWEKRQHQNSEVAPLLLQIEDLSRSLADFSFTFSSRSCNMLAHECAKLVSRSNLVEEWLVPPPSLWGIISSDLIVTMLMIYK